MLPPAVDKFALHPVLADKNRHRNAHVGPPETMVLESNGLHVLWRQNVTGVENQWAGHLSVYEPRIEFPIFLPLCQQ
jgi:hypothetical protein